MTIPEYIIEMFEDAEMKKVLDRNKVLFEHQFSRIGSRPAIKTLTHKKNLVGLEIGILFGINSLYILDNLDISFLYLIDPFSEEPLKEAYPSCETISDVEIIARKILAKYEDKIEIIKDFSWNVVDKIPDKLDFIYIDGDHSESGIERDLELYYPKVNTNGLFGGHDYVPDRPPDLMVKYVVNKFFDKKDEILRSKSRDWWVIKK